MSTNFFAGLEVVGSQVAGDQIDPNPQTVGGLTDLVFTRTYKVNSNSLSGFIFQILNPAVRVTDATVPNAYLVKQRATKIDEVNVHLQCVFAQIPSQWMSDATYETTTFPGVEPSSLFAPTEFDFRSGPTSFNTQVRMQHDYFLGPISGIATIPRFKPVNMATGLRVSTITDQTNPSSDEYISMVGGRREIVVDSVVVKWMGDIWDRRTRFALAK